MAWSDVWARCPRSGKAVKLHLDLNATDQELMHSIMSKVFVFRPEERLTATQLLHDPSFRALMEKHGVDTLAI